MLLICDDIDASACYEEGLRDAGFDVTRHRHFESASTIAAIQVPDAIVIDAQRRKRDCARFLRRMLDKNSSRRIPIVLISDASDCTLQAFRTQISLYPRFVAPHCLGAYLLWWCSRDRPV